MADASLSQRLSVAGGRLERMVSAAAWTMMLALVAMPSFSRADCNAPPELQARAQRTPDGSGYSELGTWFGEHNQFACANEAFRASLKLDPQSAKVNYFLGVSLYSAGEKEAAVAALKRSGELDANAKQPRILLATILDELNRPLEAEAQWRAVLQLDPASPDGLDGLAKDLIAEHDYLPAIDLLRGATRDEELTLDLAIAYGQAGMLTEAEGAVRQALAATPGSIRLVKALATVYVHEHRYQDAVALMREYLGEHPGDQEAEIQYLSALVLTNDAVTARPLGKKLLLAAPHDFDVLYLNGILEREAEEYLAARDHLVEAVKQQPNDYTARYNLGVTLARLNDPEHAKEQLERAVALDPAQQEAHFQLAGVLRTLKLTDAAQAQLLLFQQLKKDSAARAEADTKSEEARQKLAGGDTAQAVELYRQAVAATPGNALLQYKLGLALDQAGDMAGERKALEQAVKLDPAFALAANQLGYVASKANEPGVAETNFRLAVKFAPGFTQAWINLAATLASESKFAEAQGAVASALQLEPQNAQALELSRQLAAAAQK